MASLAVKVLVITLAIAAHRVAASHSHSNNGRGQEGHPDCRGLPREGMPCEDGSGICTRVGMPGKRYGLMQCVPSAVGPPFDPTTGYENNFNWEHCFSSPEGTTITLIFPFIEVECLGCSDPNTCPDPLNNCTWDWITVDENGDGSLELPKLCGSHVDYEYVSSSNYVCVLFRSDSSCTYEGFSVYATWA